MTNTRTEWSTNPEENQAIAQLQEGMAAMAASLYEVDEARYVDPSGGYVPGK